MPSGASRQRCERCTSQDAVRTRTTQSKVETIGSDVCYVLAVCVEVDGIPYALECVNPIRPDDMIGSGEENILNQLLVRNRQVYTDSATQVFNPPLLRRAPAQPHRRVRPGHDRSG